MEEKNRKTYQKSEIQKATLDYFNGDDLARDVWIKKYCLKDENEYYELTPDDMHRRIAQELARIEAIYPNPLSEEEIYSTIKDFKRIIPQGSPMSGIGNNFQVVSLGNCFVIGNDGDSYGGIINIDEEEAQLMKRRGGVGHDLSKIRPRQTPVKNSAITSTGVVPFMERYSNTTREVAQDGRRDALMLSISINHPDAESFIDAKLVQGKVTGANISIKITDEFMDAVIKDYDFWQTFPIDLKIPLGEIYDDIVVNAKIDELVHLPDVGYLKKVDARKLWKKIIHNAWQSAEPGVLFWDKIINESIPSSYGKDWVETSTNPCFPSSEYLLTENGYVKFGDLLKTRKKNVVICDNRISYVDDGEEKAENWKIDNNAFGVVKRNASHVFLTQKNAEIIEITTSKGFKLKCTPDHLIATTTGMVEAIDLTPEHDILIAIPNIDNGSIVNITPRTNEEIIALLIGLVTGDGAFDKSRNRVHLEFWGDDRFRMEFLVKNLIDILYESYGDKYNVFNKKLSKYFSSNDKKNNKLRISSSWLAQLFNEYDFNHKTKHDVPEFIMNNSATNIGKYYIAALLYCDGSVQGTHESGFTIRLAQSNLSLLEKVQRILHSNGMIFGIYKRRDSKMTLLPNGKGGNSNYKTKTQYELISLGGSIVKYRESIGFLGDVVKEEKMMVSHNFQIKKTYTDTIVSIEKHDNEPVYCLKEDIGRNIIVNGISARRCGELPLPLYDSCRLLSLNLYGYVVNPFKDNAYFNWDLFKHDVQIAMRYMDDIVDLEIEKINGILNKIEKDPEDEELKRVEKNLWTKIKESTFLGRRTGLGVTAEGDMLAALGYIYGTDAATDFSEEVHKQLKLNAYRSSVTMANERGTFPIYDNAKEIHNPFLNRIKEEDPELYDDMTKYGRRNIALLTIAPTGTASLMTQTTSGIEPVFLPVYRRRRKINPQEKDATVDFIDEEGIAWQEYTVFHHKFETWLIANGYNVEIVKSMTTAQVDEIIKQSPYYKATSNDVDWVKKVEMQGRIQKHIDHSISVTVNLPSDVTEDIVANVYETGWRSGCKGITVYRDGSRNGVLITNDKKEVVFHENHAPKRPKRLKGEIHRFQNNLEKWIAVVGLKDGRPYEIFTGKFENGLSNLPNNLKECEVVKNIIETEELDTVNGSMMKVRRKRYDIEYIDSNGEKQVHTGLNHAFNPEFWNYSKLISGVLRHGMPIVHIYELIDSLNFKEDYINTWKNGVARVVKRYIKDGEKGKGRCPECGSENLQFVEGCLTCKSCGYGKCG